MKLKYINLMIATIGVSIVFIIETRTSSAIGGILLFASAIPYTLECSNNVISVIETLTMLAIHLFTSMFIGALVGAIIKGFLTA